MESLATALTNIELQYGAFAICLALIVLCVLMLGVIAWIGRAVVSVVARNSTVIERQMSAISNHDQAATARYREMAGRAEEQAEILRRLQNQLLARPCQLPRCRAGTATVEAPESREPPPAGPT